MDSAHAPQPTTWGAAMGIRIVEHSAGKVVLRLAVAAVHRQPFGLVHGGVYAGLVEEAGSIGGQLNAGAGVQVVGLENQTSFLRGVREGTLTATAQPLHLGRTTQLWTTEISDERGRLVATGRLRLMCIPIP